MLPSRTSSGPDIFFYNTLTKKKEKFHSLHGRAVKMYTCGPTVYDYAHIGNFRAYVFAEIVRRTLEYAGYEVKQVMNITDIGHLVGDGDSGEDKMTAGLKREGLDLTLSNMKMLAERYAEAFEEDLKRLNIELPFTFPRASEHIPEQIAYVETLIGKGYAYATKDGVYFEVGKFPGYGALGGSASYDHARIAHNPEKRDMRDFALWKFDEKLGWEAPFGKGFPGWHIECVAMSTKYLGKTFDIHTGGVDHIAVHHNDEIAEAEAANGKPLANFWMHGEFITIEAKRIGKSEGNAVRLYQLEERGVSPLAYRYLLLTAHYRQKMNFTWEAAEAAQTALNRAQRAYREFPAEGGRIQDAYREMFREALYDDLNTPEALSIMWNLFRDDGISPEDKRATLYDFDRVLGIGMRPVEHIEAISRSSAMGPLVIPPEIEAQITEREEARKAGDFAKADKIRDSLTQKGYSVEDTQKGPVVRPI
ncbi:MAG: cysteine--tRNA ligase [Patescibacteria group bacterium]|nr:cysteine--tRNA ligase [Patescibacteria group bacterium]